jgi:hypothetical protein
MIISGDIITGMKFFYLISAIVLLAISIAVYPSLRQRASKKK